MWPYCRARARRILDADSCLPYDLRPALYARGGGRDEGGVMRLRTLAVTAVDAYGLAGRRWPLRWGASSREATARLPGDELVADPDLVATRAMLRSIRDRAERAGDRVRASA